jgi:hypothetical protein
MEEFQAYAPEEIILSNLEELLERSLKTAEQELAHLRELAAEIAANVSDEGDFPAALPDHRIPSMEAEIALPHHLQAYAAPLYRAAATRRRALLCTELRRLIPALEGKWQEFFFPAEEKATENAKNRITYQRNSYADEAYQQFSKLFSEARASYTHSFSEVCEAVYNGFSEYCILPVENSTEGRLSSFARLIERYELKLAATCDVSVGEGKITKFALLRRSIEPLIPKDPLPHYFAFSCELSEELGVEDLTGAAALCGLRWEQLDLNRAENVLHGVLREGEGDLPAYLLYLAMEAPSYTPMGIYPHLSQKILGARP